MIYDAIIPFEGLRFDLAPTVSHIFFPKDLNEQEAISSQDPAELSDRRPALLQKEMLEYTVAPYYIKRAIMKRKIADISVQEIDLQLTSFADVICPFQSNR